MARGGGENELGEKEPSSPVVKWVNVWLIEMIKSGVQEKELRRADLPPVSVGELDWLHVVNRLKVMASVLPIAHSDMRSGKFIMSIPQMWKGTFQFHVEFAPGYEPESVKVRWRALPEEPGEGDAAPRGSPGPRRVP
jgi:hypothetical protein